MKTVVRQLKKIYDKCHLCPHRCGVNRNKGQLGICRSTAQTTVASYNLHFGEEPPISGFNGSGTIFLGNCNLRCIFCQNYPISQLQKALRTVTSEELAKMMLELQSRGAHNINFVTPTHYIPGIVEAIFIARDRGLRIPIVYNSSGYETPEVTKKLEGVIDIYMPDFKYADEEVARKYSSAPDYPAYIEKVLLEMYRQVGHLQINEEGVAERGLLIRHLVLPNNLNNSMNVLKRIKEILGTEVYISLMNQYFPAYKAFDYDINRPLSRDEYKKIVDYFFDLGFNNGYLQGYEEVRLW